MMTYDYYQDYNPINISNNNCDVHFNLSVPANPWECLGNRSAVLQLGFSVAVQSILSSPHHCFFHHEHHHQQTSSSWLLWSSAATSRTIYTAILCTKAEDLKALSSTPAKLFSHCLLITIPFGTKHFRSECVFSVDINGLFLTFSKSWLPLPKFRLNCLGSFFSVETYWTAGLTLKNRRNGFSIKPIQNKEMPIAIMQNTGIICFENSLNWLNCKALPY